MPKIKVRVQLTEDALKDFKVIQKHKNVLVSDWGVKYLKGLIELPPQNWLGVRRNWDEGVFKTSGFVPFDIRGKVEHYPGRQIVAVFITHFKLKDPQSKVWFEQNQKREAFIKYLA